jgi:uncharacterized protein (TIGR02001 family)
MGEQTMISLKHAAAGAALVLASSAATAEVSGNVGVVTDYLFRGITQTGGPAIQGGIDYAHSSGLYAGTWASNVAFAGGGGATGTEQDFYAGFAKEFGAFGVDVGVIYYWYPEEGEDKATGASQFSTVEAGITLSLGPVALSYHYADKAKFFLGDGLAGEAGFLNLALDQPIADGLNLQASIGHYGGAEIDRAVGDEYLVYSLGLAKEFGEGFSATFHYIATNMDATTHGLDDKPKFVVGLSKSFDF